MKKKFTFTGVSTRNGFFVALLFLFLLVPALFIYAANPIVSHVYTADPSGFVGTDGRLYVVTSHDQNGATDYSQLYDYYLFSSDDLVNWQDHGIIFNARRDTSWANLAYARIWRTGMESITSIFRMVPVLSGWLFPIHLPAPLWTPWAGL
jgi:hypothetical protein